MKKILINSFISYLNIVLLILPETVLAAKQNTGQFISSAPVISPDYTDLIIPSNIAPLNFKIQTKALKYQVKVHSKNGPPINITSRSGDICFSLSKWQTLIHANKGQEIIYEISILNDQHKWQHYKPVKNTVSTDTIDNTLVYRFMRPIYNWWKDIRIFQRNLSTYKTSLVLSGQSFRHGCLNCHSFVNNKPDQFSIGLRSAKYGSHTLLANQSNITKIGTKWGYTAWHPSGKLAVYSLNKVRQFFHLGSLEVRDVVDLDSALACYYVDQKKIICPAALADKQKVETYPTWSPDGKYLYYCSAAILWKDRDTVPPKNYQSLKYDLCRVQYDINTNQWGKSELVLSAKETKLSILLPRISPDGRFLLFCMCKYGCFPIYQPSSDLYLMDLGSGKYHKLNINSKYSESWHSFSSNSRWIAFSSKRQGGTLTRTYLSYIDNNGIAHKAFVVPQQDPEFYSSVLETYSVPELVTGPLKISPAKLARSARKKPDINLDIPITGATPKKPASTTLWQERE